jgi:uncharacterized protein (TIGR02687 family)
MDTTQIQTIISHIYNEEKVRIVFWNDPEKEFEYSLPFIMLEDVNILNLDEIGALEAKIQIEREDPQSRYLLYSNSEEPEYEDDWLLDIRLYSRSFRADRASLIFDELGLRHHHLREHLALRRKYFDNKGRLQKLKQLVTPDDNEQDLDRKMLAIVTKAEVPDIFNIIITLFQSQTEEDELDLEIPPTSWNQIEKYDLEKSFWHMVKVRFGYSDENPNLHKLLIRLMVSDYVQSLGVEIPTSLQHLQLPKAGTANAVVCLAQWRDHNRMGGSYDILSQEISGPLHIAEYLHGIDIEALLDVMTFFEVEKEILGSLRERVSATAEAIDPDVIRKIVTRRQAGHWISSTSIPETKRTARYAVYEALAVASEFFSLRNKYREGFEFEDAKSMYQAYEKELYRYDQSYRHFCENADLAESQGWDVLKPLREEIEACYCNWYLTMLALAWGKYVESELINTWRIENIPNEQKFFKQHVKPQLAEGDRRRVFVIISDAFRYEAAQELTAALNGKYRIQAELTSQLGVLPSYTALGMASLLPHEELEYKPNGDVLVDGKPTASLIQRSQILDRIKGLAIKAEDLLAMKKEAGRECISGKLVVYIYHDEIDSHGEKASSEKDTFEAVRKTIDKLADLVSYIINNLNGNHVVLTADHGFVFTETAPSETDKSKLDEKPKGTIKAKKRYLIGNALPDNDCVWHGNTLVTANAKGDMEFWVPKGTNRFHFTGGARYVHGGAMLQEVVIPVITIKHLKDKSTRVQTKPKHVTVQVLGDKHKITTQKYRFKLLQMEPVSDRAKPITLKVAVYDKEQSVTNIESVKFDSKSDNMNDRQKSVILTLQDREYDKNKPYHLILRDADTGIDQQSMEVHIDRTISDDFDF